MKNYINSRISSKKVTGILYTTLVFSFLSLGVNAGSRTTCTQSVGNSSLGTRNSLIRRKTENHPKSNFRTEEIDLIRFEISDGKASDEALIYFVDGGSDTFDPDFDARKISNGNLNLSSYCYKVGFDMAINGISNTLPTYIPIKIEAQNANVCTLKFSEFVNTSARKLYIYDKTEDTYTSIVEGGTMNLGGGLNNCIGRFFLTSTVKRVITGFQSTSTNATKFQLSPNPYSAGSLKIKSAEAFPGAVNFEIIGIDGNVFKSFSQFGNYSGSDFEYDLEEEASDLPNGTYLIKINNGITYSQQKVIINK